MNSLAKIGAVLLTAAMMIFTVVKAQGCSKQEKMDVLPATKAGPVNAMPPVAEEPQQQGVAAKDAGADATPDAAAAVRKELKELKVLPATKSGVLPATKSAPIRMFDVEENAQEAKPQQQNNPKRR